VDKRKGLSVLFAFSLALNCAFIGAWVYHFFFVRPAIRARMLERAGAEGRVIGDGLADLNLTEEQQRKLAAQQAALRLEIQDVRSRTDAARERLLDLLAAPEPDPEAVKAAQQEIAAGQEEVRRLVFDHLTRAREVLTPEQWGKLQRMLRDMHGPRPEPMRRMRRSPREGPPPPGQPGEGQDPLAPDKSDEMLQH
jgi:Spy/CpxP family protein refolding chaperone